MREMGAKIDVKKLQQNFTTPEQSKRLLAIGLPVDSADCYLALHDEFYACWFRQNDFELNSEFFQSPRYLPCWSVGRLIEIYCRCLQNSKGYTVVWGIDQMAETLVRRMEDFVSTGFMDFSKLEG